MVTEVGSEVQLEFELHNAGYNEALLQRWQLTVTERSFLLPYCCQQCPSSGYFLSDILLLLLLRVLCKECLNSG